MPDDGAHAMVCRLFTLLGRVCGWWSRLPGGGEVPLVECIARSDVSALPLGMRAS
jgi:hypothetical protein